MADIATLRVEKLHLGCGKRYLLGYKHVDLADFPHIDYRSSISDLSFLTNESIAEIYSSHSFEYFSPRESIVVLEEWHRVLIPGGVIRIAVPNFDSLIEIYERDKSITSILGPLFGEWTISSPEGEQTFYHKTVYNRVSLSERLAACGFGKIESYDPVTWLSTIDPNYDDHSLAFFPHMDRRGIQVSLCLTAIKS